MSLTKTLVRTNVTLTEEDYCLYNMNNEHIKAVTTLSDDFEVLPVDVKFDKCDCTKATLVICVLFSQLEEESEVKIYVKAGARVVTTLCVNKIYSDDLTNGNVTKANTVELFGEHDVQGTNALQVILPLTEDLKCLAPDYGTNNPLAVKTLYETPVKVTVKSKNNVLVDGCLIYDMRNCEVCLDVKYLNLNNLETYNVYGVNKCTETVLFSFQLCLDVVIMDGDQYPLYSIRSNNCDYCYRILEEVDA